MKEGNVILTAIIQADGRDKKRPALILRKLPKFGDLLICGISTKLYQYTPDFDEIIRVEDPDFIKSGLTQESLVRLAFMSVIRKQAAIGSIGEIDVDRHHRLLHNISNYLKPKPQESLSIFKN
jgi:mRNA interferase MazF